ncbi:hypothetical protein VTN77DRAFT_8727 [Rasamsonia byssochlamydoides]|uniref:uncharacterized protein n=1 Tax=Rasamsonia byssochlamydoides TaxID=89139 RepID=UPI003742ECAC
MAGTGKNLDSLPYDVLYQITCGLDCHDFINLARVNRALNASMRDERLAKRSVERHMSHTKEGRLAFNGKITFREAIERLYEIKEAVALAQPYSAAILSYAAPATFLYQEGVLCYLYCDEIRVLDVHQAEKVEHVLNAPNIISRVTGGAYVGAQLSLLHYSVGVLAILVELGGGQHPWLIVLDVTPQSHKQGRLRHVRRLQSTRRLFVRHNGTYLFYGTHSFVGVHGYHQWAVQVVDLKNRKPLTQKPIILEDFAGSDIGQSVCFEIFQDHLYAVSSLVSFEEEEVDWTSFYVWACLPPTGNMGRPRLNRIWRRQHREGPINDTWTDMSLRQDEATGELMIFECRREWRNGGSDNIRTYYRQPLPFPAEAVTLAGASFSSSSSSSSTGSSSGPSAPLPSDIMLPDEPLTMTLDEDSKPNYARPEKRLPRHVHPEYSPEDDVSQRRDFILVRTKYRTYNPSASAFLDLVNDPPQSSQRAIPPDRLRVRISSRKRKCPFDEEGRLIPREVSSSGEPIPGSEERFVSRGTKLWPPDDAPEDVVDLLCPSKTAAEIQAAADERSLVYSVNVEDGCQAIVLISFDPRIRIPSMRRLGGGSNVHAEESTAAVDIEQPRVGDSKGKTRSAVLTGDGPAAPKQPSFRTEKAMHLSINRGYWFGR